MEEDRKRNNDAVKREPLVSISAIVNNVSSELDEQYNRTRPERGTEVC
jgi:hypothetical protein